MKRVPVLATSRPVLVRPVSTGLLSVISIAAGLALYLLLEPYDVVVGEVAIVLGAATLMLSPTGRVVWLVAGGLALLETTSSLSPAKLVYFSGVAIAAVLAQVRIAKLWKIPDMRRLRPAIYASWGFSGYILACTLPYTVIVKQLSVGTWARDAFAHLLIPSAIIIAMGAYNTIKARTAVLLITLVGAVSTVFYAVTWISRRQLVGETPVFLLGSRAILALPFCLGVALAFHYCRVKPLWVFYSITLASVAILSINRATVLIFAAPLVMAIPGVAARIPIRRIVCFYFFLAGTLWLTLRFVAPIFLSEELVRDRVASTLGLLSRGDGSFDQSAYGRSGLTDQALFLFEQDRPLGAGLGAVSFVDTPAVYLAKWGLFGTIVILLFFAAVFVPLVRSVELTAVGHSVTSVVSAGVGGAWVLSLLSGAPTEDIGLPLALALLFLLRVSSRNGDRTERPGEFSYALGR